MLVLVLALANCIIGVEVGLRYSVLIVPALTAIVLPEIGLLEAQDESWSLLRITGLITSLQIGYLLGSAIRWLPVRAVHPSALAQPVEPSSPARGVAPISALKVLIVEDDVDVSMLVEEMLRELGCAVIWRCSSASEASAVLRERRPDAAVLDIKLRGEFVYPVAAQLDSARIPFVFASGDYSSVPSTWARRPRIQKPFEVESLAAGLASALDSNASRSLTTQIR